MSKFEQAIEHVLANEGGYSDRANDRGGRTNFGISERFILSLKPEDKVPVYDSDRNINDVYIKDFDQIGIKNIHYYIRNLTKELAKLIYQRYFWLPIYEQIEDQDICNFIFDMHVQHGKSKAAELTQRAHNSASIGCHMGHMAVDGIFGGNTLTMINWLLRKKANSIDGDEFNIGILFMKSNLIAVRESLFRCIVAHDPSQQEYLEGWINRCYK